MKAIAWACCYLDPDDPVYDALSTLGIALQRMGMKLVLFGEPGDYRKYTGFQHVAVPLWLADHGRLYADFFAGAGLPMGAATLSEMMALDHAFGVNLPDAESEFLILRAIAFWERAFDLMQPSIVLGWGTSVPFARLLVRLGQRRQVPAYIMERGLLENTLSLSLGGQVALSSAGTSPALVRPEQLEGRHLELWSGIETYYRKIGKQQRHGSNRDPNPEEESFLQSDPSPRVLFLGNFDIGSGCSLNDPILAERVGTWVISSETAAQSVVDVLRALAPGATFWSKPHPGSPFMVSYDGGDLTVRNMHEINVHRLVQAADIVVTLTSTTQMLALVYDKPLVTLANGFFMGRDIAYEVASKNHLRPMLAAALAKEGWDERLRLGRALLTAMMEHDLFGINNEVPTRLRVDDLALLLGRFARYVKPDMAPADERFAAFVKFRNEAEGGRSVLSSHKEILAAEVDALRAQILALRVEKSVLLTELRKLILERARLVFDPSELTKVG